MALLATQFTGWASGPLRARAGQVRPSYEVTTTYLTVNVAEARVLSHCTESSPPLPLGLTAISIFSITVGSAVTFIGMWTRSWRSSYAVPHWPVCLFTINSHLPP